MATASGIEHPILYHPRGLYMWDTWYLHSQGRTHLFHLQVRRPDSPRPEEDHGAIGHAVSGDLLHWEELPTALQRGAPGRYDDGTLFTGYAVEHKGLVYLFYTGNHWDPDGTHHQAICLATSEDGVHFRKHPDNPLIRPDGRRYLLGDNSRLDGGDHYSCHCRDIVVLRDPASNGWLGYVVMRLKRGETRLSSYHDCCIALCRSRDLVHWELGDPCFAPDRYRVFEVPDVFPLGSRWYMINLTGDTYGQRNRWGDPNVRHGIIVAEADGPAGPFQEVRDNSECTAFRVLLAANNWQGFSARTVEVRGERLLFYTRDEGDGSRAIMGSLSWPAKLTPRPGGGLQLEYWGAIERAFNAPQLAPPVTLQDEEGWSLRSVEPLPSHGRAFMLSATISLETAKAAGLAFRQGHVNACFWLPANGPLVVLDPANGEVSLVRLHHFTPLQRLRWAIGPGKLYKVRVIAMDGFVEVYVDDVLALNYFDTAYGAGSGEGGIALFVEGGVARFSDIAYRTLKDPE